MPEAVQSKKSALKTFAAEHPALYVGAGVIGAGLALLAGVGGAMAIAMTMPLTVVTGAVVLAIPVVAGVATHAYFSAGESVIREQREARELAVAPMEASGFSAGNLSPSFNATNATAAPAAVAPRAKPAAAPALRS